MDVVEIRNIIRKDIPLHYREEFAGLAILKNRRSEQSEVKFEFSLERTPFGTKQVEIKFSIAPDFPVLPAIKPLKEYILKMEKEGMLR